MRAGTPPAGPKLIDRRCEPPPAAPFGKSPGICQTPAPRLEEYYEENIARERETHQRKVDEARLWENSEEDRKILEILREKDRQRELEINKGLADIIIELEEIRKGAKEKEGVRILEKRLAEIAAEREERAKEIREKQSELEERTVRVVSEEERKALERKEIHQ
ncbi:hypothetical protein BGX38DRAFT_1276717 [Terfezia claveryi]|nr:hypothetical protein BGX38DRAFT_1276717 [Terfezia claveryi]